MVRQQQNLPTTTPSIQQQQQMYQAATPHFPNYGGIPATFHHPLNVYSPVGHNIPSAAEVDRFLMQQIPAFATLANTSIDIPFSALSMAGGQPMNNNAGIMATAQHQQQQQQSHQRSATNEQNTNSSFMDLGKYQQHQSAGMGVNSNSGLPNSGSYQQHAMNQQRSLNNVENSLIGAGGNVVAPPPGFGMPAQQAYIPQPTNVQSLFQVFFVFSPLEFYCNKLC
jgi:hypothetical protein